MFHVVLVEPETLMFHVVLVEPEWLMFHVVVVEPEALMFHVVIVEPETLLKAISKVDDMDYHILDNNCEHFAVWCKTGRMKSFQVRTTIEHLI